MPRAFSPHPRARSCPGQSLEQRAALRSFRLQDRSCPPQSFLQRIAEHGGEDGAIVRNDFGRQGSYVGILPSQIYNHG